MSSLSERILLSIIRFCTCAILFLPLLITTSTFFPYIFGKMIFFELLVEIATACWIILMIHNPVYRPRWKNPVTICLTVFVGVMLLTAFTGIDPMRSLWSSQERMTGVIVLLHFWAWYLVMTSVNKTKGEWRALTWSSLICSVLVALYGFGQLAHISGLFTNATGDRLASTLGNPIYLGVYGLFHILLVAFLWTGEKRSTWQSIVLIVIAFVNGSALLLSQSRSAFFVLGCAVVAGVVVVALRKTQGRVRIASIAVIVAGIALTIIAFAWLQTDRGTVWGRAHLPSSLQRVATSGFVDKNRIELWRLGWLGFLDRPLFGWGLENYNAVYYTHAVPDHNGIRIEDAYFDRSHNEFVDLLALSGIFGFLAYVALLLVAAQKLMKQFFSGDTAEEKRLSFVLLLALVAYVLQNITVFDTPASLIFFYLLLALIANASDDEVQTVSAGTTSAWWAPFARVGVGMCFVIISWIVVWTPLRASQLAIGGVLHADQGRFGEALDEFNQSLTLDSLTNREVRRAIADTAMNMAATPALSSRLSAWLPFAVAELEKNNTEEPREIRNNLALAQLYRIGASVDPSFIGKAKRVLDEASLFAPGRVEVMLEHAEIAVLEKDTVSADAWLTKAEKLDENGPLRLWRSGIVRYQLKEYAASIRDIRDAVSHKYSVDSESPIFTLLAKEIPSATLNVSVIADFDALIKTYPQSKALSEAKKILLAKYRP
ncbi:MAG: O-antigen ligase family protein [bacterium]|nr:O-antigen ligase family protein [bacterium]